MRSEKKKILLYGSCPYGNGGASKNIKRLVSYAKEHELDLEFDVYHYNECSDIKKCGHRVTGFNVFKLLNKKKYEMVMVYSIVNWRFQLVVYIASILYGLKIIVSIRNDRFKDIYNSLRIFEKIIFRFYNSRISYVVGVNQNSDYLFIDRKKISIIPGYIEPSPDEYECELPEEIDNFFRVHRTVIVSNASKLWKYKGVDLYGVDMAIELLAELSKRGQQGIGILFVISWVDENHKSYLEELESRIVQLGLGSDFLIWKHPISFPAILKKCDISMRLTTSDGDSISLRESLFFGKPVVASDVAPRPVGALLFKSRDLSDLTEKTLMLLSASTSSKPVEETPLDDNAASLIRLFQSVLEY